MPRYFFHTRIGADTITDPTGTELRDADHAWDVARDTAQAAMQAETASRLLGAVLVVTDAEGEVVLEFPFAEAVTLAPDSDETVH
ncbi:hypothetical protein G3T14_00865 [Methylobacterium sp. BTF04]|uniref:DUF6894 family protein n=1 Tax=Methylobacterium sp. BTF04 TaxID=2708300 RepID=UPI0013D1371C|nr:hypothetical protein [Methylobacterium sp. BTF04]NEU10680.1 hypothetical protein [Methylobacterium sp. BTF04]